MRWSGEKRRDSGIMIMGERKRDGGGDGEREKEGTWTRGRPRENAHAAD